MAFSIRNLRIRQQILLVTLPPLAVLLGMIGFLFYVYWMARHNDQVARQSEESIAHGEALLRQLTEAYAGVRGYALTRRATQLGPHRARMVQIEQEFAALWDLEADEPAHLALLLAIRADITRWQTEWAGPVIDKVREGKDDEVRLLQEEGERQMTSLRDRIAHLLKEERAQSVAQRQASEQAMRRMLLLSLGVALLVAGVVLAVMRKVTHVIAQPVRQLISASEQVSRGDFNLSLPDPPENEFGVLAKSFVRMTTALREEREELASLSKFSEAASQCTAESEIYDHVLHSLRERFHPNQVMIFKLSHPENFLEVVSTLHPLPETERAWPVIEEPHNCKAVRMGRSFCINDVNSEPRCPSKFKPPTDGSYYCGPLIAGGIIVGAVRLEGEKDFWTPERAGLLENYLHSASTALSNLRLMQSMRQQANVDELTGLSNRRFVDEYARKLIAMARRRGRSVGFIMLDIDHFKEINDLYGHEVGDRALRQFAKTVTQAMRETNLAARFGGEEFVVILPDTGPKACLVVAERIREAVARMTVPSGTDKPLPKLTVSVGVATYPEHGQTTEELVQACDKALYESKRSGRNCSTLYVTPSETPTS